jgi:Tol biopolymer transport system component
MGEVYRARDSKLQRDVALKILPDLFALDAERLARFKREAQVLASVNHQNIGAIYGLEESPAGLALVLELVEGPTLADRIAEGPIPFDEVRPIARQIADAMEAAHEQGVVHRDLKPANIKLRPDGTVKVLDFGLAKALDPGSSVHDVSMSPTIITMPAATRVGMILGTAAYMAPEQARGRSVDKRADIWAFGAVLYEMLTGRRAFEGEDVTEMLGAVIHKEPAWDALPAETPPHLVDLIRRCLKKDPRERLRDIGDARIALEDALARVPSPVPAGGPRRAVWPQRIAILALGVALMAALPFVVAHLREVPPAAATVRFTMAPPEGSVFTGGAAYSPGATISPDGRRLVFQAARSGGGAALLWIRDLDTVLPRALPGTDGGFFAFWSPDSQSVAFFANGKLKTIDVAGGPPLAVCDAPAGEGGTWNRDGTIVFAPATVGALTGVSAAGGQPVAVTKLDVSRKDVSHRWPQFLPDGRHFIFIAQPGNAVMVGSLDSSDVKLLGNVDSKVMYSPPGYLLFVRQGTLMARPFDALRTELTGDAFPLVEQIRYNGGNARAAFSVSNNGVLAFRTAEAVKGSPVWVDRNGHELSSLVSAPLDAAEFPRLSPEGRRLALVVADDVWVYDLDGRPPIKITFDGQHYAPLWTPDGKRLVYETSAPAPLRSLPADGSGGTPERMSPDGHFHPHGWSVDGRDLIVAKIDGDSTSPDIMKLSPGAKSDPQMIVQTPAAEGAQGTALSPDGRWLAYTSDATGQMEIWVRPYPGPGAPIRVSPNGGVEPVWARNGRELFYLEGIKMMSVTIDARDGFTFKPAALLFESTYVHGGQPPSYDVAADGRFIMIKATNPRATAAPVTIVLNWAEKLRK